MGLDSMKFNKDLQLQRCSLAVEVLDNNGIRHFAEYEHNGKGSRLPLHLGMIGIGLNALIFIYTSILAWSVKRFDEKWGLKKWEVTSIAALPFITAFGLISFSLFTFALWPIWSFLTLPLVFTLFMACTVITPYLIFGKFRPQYDELRTY